MRAALRRLLQRALGNLLSNAIRHTPAEGAVRVTLSAGNDGAVVTVERDWAFARVWLYDAIEGSGATS